MRVLVVLPAFYGSGGNAVNERQLTIALAQKAEKCYVITDIGFSQIFTKKREDMILLPKNMAVIPLPVPHPHILITYFIHVCVSCLISILGLILNAVKEVDLFYIRSSFLSFGFLTFQSIAKKTIVKIPAISEDEIPHEGATKFLVKYCAQFLDRMVLSKANRVAVGSVLFYEEIVRRRCVRHKREPLEITPGISMDVIRKVKDQIHRESARKSISIGFVGLLSWWQGVDILVQAMALLAKKIPDLKLVIIGDGALRPLIEKTCKNSNFNYEITGFTPHFEALRRLATLDIMVLPSRKTTTTEHIIPIKVMEAWALGTPVIVTRHQAFLATNIRDFDEVLYCEPEPSDVAKSISTLLSDGDLRERLKINGPRLAIRFDYNKIAEKLLGARVEY